MSGLWFSLIGTVCSAAATTAAVYNAHQGAAIALTALTAANLCFFVYHAAADRSKSDGS